MAAPGWPPSIREDIGQLDTIASGPNILRRAWQWGDYQSTEEVFDAARKGNEDSLRVIQEAASALGIAVANAVSLVGPELVLLSGGMSTQADFSTGPLQQAIDSYAQPYARRAVRVKKATLGPEAGLLGAAKLAFDSLKS